MGVGRGKGRVVREGFLGDDVLDGDSESRHACGEWLAWGLELESHCGRWGVPVGRGLKGLAWWRCSC